MVIAKPPGISGAEPDLKISVTDFVYLALWIGNTIFVRTKQHSPWTLEYECKYKDVQFVVQFGSLRDNVYGKTTREAVRFLPVPSIWTDVWNYSLIKTGALCRNNNKALFKNGLWLFRRKNWYALTSLRVLHLYGFCFALPIPNACVW